jgi:peptidyl-prolyl cis-trans isomerase-like protein 2
MYITASEWAVEFGGKKEAKNRPTSFRGALPFYHCAFSLQPIQGDAVCTPDGRLFDIVYVETSNNLTRHRNLLPYIQQHKSSPVTGEPLELKDIIHLKWHKNNEGTDCYSTILTFRCFALSSNFQSVQR